MQVAIIENEIYFLKGVHERVVHRRGLAHEARDVHRVGYLWKQYITALSIHALHSKFKLMYYVTLDNG